MHWKILKTSKHVTPTYLKTGLLCTRFVTFETVDILLGKPVHWISMWFGLLNSDWAVTKIFSYSIPSFYFRLIKSTCMNLRVVHMLRLMCPYYIVHPNRSKIFFFFNYTSKWIFFPSKTSLANDRVLKLLEFKRKNST